MEEKDLSALFHYRVSLDLSTNPLCLLRLTRPDSIKLPLVWTGKNVKVAFFPVFLFFSFLLVGVCMARAGRRDCHQFVKNHYRIMLKNLIS